MSNPMLQKPQEPDHLRHGKGWEPDIEEQQQKVLDRTQMRVANALGGSLSRDTVLTFLITDDSDDPSLIELFNESSFFKSRATNSPLIKSDRDIPEYLQRIDRFGPDTQERVHQSIVEYYKGKNIEDLRGIDLLYLSKVKLESDRFGDFITDATNKYFEDAKFDPRVVARSVDDKDTLSLIAAKDTYEKKCERFEKTTDKHYGQAKEDQKEKAVEQLKKQYLCMLINRLE